MGESSPFPWSLCGLEDIWMNYVDVHFVLSRQSTSFRRNSSDNYRFWYYHLDQRGPGTGEVAK